jgi:type IV secretory pathway VirB6-like protein
MLKRLISAGLLLMLAGSAFAGDVEAVSKAINALFSTSAGLAEKGIFAAEGQRLLSLLLVILISWQGIHLALNFSPFAEVVVKIAKIGLLCGIASFMLTSTTQQNLVKGFDYLAAKAASATGAPVNMDDPAKGIQSVMATGLQTALNLWRSAPEAEDKKPWMQTIASDGLSNFLLGGLGEVIAKVAIMVLIVITLGVYCFVIASAMVLVQIGLAMAPIMVPWLLWESTAFLFNSWLKFLIVAGVTKIVSSLMLGMTWGLLEAVKTLANSAAAGPVFDEFAYLTAALLSLLMAYLMLQTYSIANGLVSGLPSVAMPNFRRPGNPSQKPSSPTRPPAPNQ